jgi:hypothetical protein
VCSSDLKPRRIYVICFSHTIYTAWFHREITTFLTI